MLPDKGPPQYSYLFAIQTTCTRINDLGRRGAESNARTRRIVNVSLYPLPPIIRPVIAAFCATDQPSALRLSSASRLWSAINRNPTYVLSGLVTLFVAIACGQGATKLLWCDELISLAIARQGSFATIWRALAAGADPNPPLSHWLIFESIRFFGESALAIRLPDILCVLFGIVALWSILRRWVCPGYAAAGALAFMATRGFDYAYNARSYAPLICFSMASLWLWLVSCDSSDGDRKWSRVGALAMMAAALALGISSNYYGVLAFFPIALGEAVRNVRARRFQPGAWVAMAVAATPLIAFLPLIRHSISEFVPYAWNRTQTGMMVESYLELVEGVFWPVLALALYAAWKGWKASDSEGSRQPARGATLLLRPHEATALATLILYPVLGYLVATGGAGMIGSRCVIPVCCGFGIAAALLGRRIFADDPRAGVIFLGVALFWVVARESACAIILAHQRTEFFALRDEVAGQPAKLPIVVGDFMFVLPLAHYSQPDVRGRIVFPIDFNAIHATEATDSVYENLWAGRNGIFPIRIVPYDSAAFTQNEIILIARPDGWLAQRLSRDGFHLGQPDENRAWQNVGGVFTSLSLFETRLQTAARN
jgi:hypothetical protein